MSILALARRARPPLVIASVMALAVACAEIGSDPNAIVSVEFNRLPSPGILVGDTLRTLEGELAFVRDSVKLFDQETDPITDEASRASIRFVPTVDSARVRWDSTAGYLVSTAKTGLRTVGVQAQVGGLFPPPVSLAIVPFAPTALTRVDTDTNRIAFGFLSSTKIGELNKEVTVRLVARDTATGGDSLVTGWPVEFRVVSIPASIDSVRVIASASDTLASSRPSPYDTTASGTASRQLAAWRKAETPIAAGDTVVVRARYRVRRELRDSVEWRIPLVALTPPTLQR